VFALKAGELGLDKDPAVQARLVQVRELLLADLFFQNLDKTATIPDLEPRARELYKADPARFTTSEHVNVQHIIISFNKRTQEMALERASQARAEALTSGTKEGFLAVAAKFNDDPDRKRHGGDLGLMGPKSFPEPIAQAIARMKTRGEISQPIETEQGYHLVRFEERKPGELLPFAAVASKLMEAERERILKERRTAQINDVRGSKTVIVHRANVESMVVPFDAAAAVQRDSGPKPR
jgi:parvulin-like peptidyl-prolyl isomerase